MKLSIYLIISIILFSCKKEVLNKIQTSSELSTDEIIDNNFLNFQRSYTLQYRLYYPCGSGQFDLIKSCKLIDGEEVNGKCFYKISTKLEKYLSQKGPNDSEYYESTNWQFCNMYYRYDPIERKSYISPQKSDSARNELFDFNCSVGDVIILDSVFQIKFKVTQILDESFSNNQSYPIIIGKLIHFDFNEQCTPNGDIHPASFGEILISPFLPHPVWFDKKLTLNDLPQENINITLSDFNQLKGIQFETKTIQGSFFYNSIFNLKGLLPENLEED